MTDFCPSWNRVNLCFRTKTYLSKVSSVVAKNMRVCTSLATTNQMDGVFLYAIIYSSITPIDHVHTVTGGAIIHAICIFIVTCVGGSKALRVL